MTLSEGTILKSRYKIIKKIGGGGFGQVYLAEDTLKESLWAVKEMDVEDLSDKDRTEIREQFWFEAKILVKLSHPQLPKIEDFFEDNEKYYIVMEYIKGKDLFDLIKLSSEPFPVEEVTQWVIKICNVLEYLHKQKPQAVIFRDLKPENVMLSDTGEIKLIDFGISKLFDVNRHTRNYAKAASPYFSSPEQYGGKTTDTRSDIFSLGATMYYIYTGNFPVDAIERAINEIPIPVPSNFNSKIPKQLDNIILKAMELNKENRYQTVEEITEALLACIAPGEKAKEQKKICLKCQRENPYMSRFCGRCGLPLIEMAEEPKFTPEPEEKIEPLPETIYSGSKFIFIHGSNENPVRILKKTRGAEEYTEQIITGPAIISRYHYSVKTSLLVPEESNIIHLRQFFIIPDKKIYMSWEEIKLFSFSPGLKGEKLKIVLQGRDKKEIFYEYIMELDEEGISYKVLPPCKDGEYILKIIKADTILDEIFLHVYENLPPSLDIKINYYRVDTNTEEGNSFTVDLYLSKDGLPFNGLLKVILLCNDSLIATVRPDIEEGRFNFKFNTGNDTGPFILKGEGTGTFQLFIPEKEREEKHINIGNYFEIAPAELPGRTDRGIFYKKLTGTDNIIEFQELEGETGRIKVLDDLDIMQIAVINPVDGESNIYDFNNISKNSLLEFQTYSPYCLVHTGIWKNQPLETVGIIISPIKLSPLMDVKQKAVPGEEVDVIIETEGIYRCLLLVTDFEIQDSPMLRKITRDLYHNIKKNIELESEEAGKKDNDTYHVEPLIKDREGEIIYSELFTLDRTAKKIIKMPDKPGLCHIYSYILKATDYKILHRTLIIEENIFIEFDLPRMMNRDDRITGKIYFSSPENADLLISTASDYFEGTVSGTGSTDFEVSQPGEITGELSSGNRHWKVTHRISPGAIENITCSEITLLRKGEVIEGENIKIYPGYQLLARSIEAIQNFSLESSEVLSSKLAAMAIKYKLLSHNDITGDIKELENNINSGLTLLNIFVHDGLFSLWEESKPSIDVSIKILSNMKHFLAIPFPLAHRLIETCTEALLNKGVRKYALTGINARFMPMSGKIETPILNYLYGPQSIKGQMAEIIKLLALKDGDGYYWKGDDFWGGNLEATCYAIKVMHLCKEEEFFNKGLTFILKQLKNETLNSTSDTLSFIELLSEINLTGSHTYLVNGELSSDTSIIHGKIEALENMVIVKKDREKQINYMEKAKKIPLSIDVVPDRAIIGEAISIIIKPRIKTLCPVAKIFLPGNIDLLDITPGIQTVTLPVITDSLEIKALVVRKGKGKIHAVIEDFYKSDYCGYGESVDIITGES